MLHKQDIAFYLNRPYVPESAVKAVPSCLHDPHWTVGAEIYAAEVLGTPPAAA